MAELKTKVNKASVEKFLNAITDKQKRDDCFSISKIMEKATKSKPEMWGPSIVGFGRRKYTYASGKEGEWMTIGFSPRKQNIALYGLKISKMAVGGSKENKGKKNFSVPVGTFKEGGGCLYVTKLSGNDKKELEKIIKRATRFQ